ncbi:hypothetical protein [Scleromatobacter humisilvae]|uniref:Uncharacterized protein n=1 Tax=Scleromatobacter humisilvae TaxID=2897159 RepID=A0A9X1YPT0_9BURK|nr:hypothetical protein [Scleromatobacter humisilvae]MCK9688477.1 hypothetical protein [Scleromatobacter humisilvae]
MTKKRTRASQRRQAQASTTWTAAEVGLDPQRYDAMLRSVFDHPVPREQHLEWCWDADHLPFEASSLEWTRFQAVLFGNAGSHLAAFDDEQVGMGLGYLMDNGRSDVPYAAIDPSVPIDEAMRMMRAMPGLWRDCFGPRLANVRARIGSGAGGRLGTTCYMWFDVWPTFYLARELPEWRDAMSALLLELLGMPWRAVQVSALHGIGHSLRHLDGQKAMAVAIDALLSGLDPSDDELRAYALAARLGLVQ